MSEEGKLKAKYVKSDVDFYSSDYFAAKARFLAVCERLGCELHSLPIDAPSPTGEPLTIDVAVAVAGAARPARAVVVSSGVHGVEAFFGSAVQVAYLERLPADWRPPAETAFIFIHAVNPFGFAWQRRFNEENVDLNRNFLLPGEAYSGAPPLCGTFRAALMRDPNRRRFSPPGSRMALLALRHGVRSFWETLPVGQYEFADWLFFGGSGRSQSAELLGRLLPGLLETCDEVVHLDYHTGLGRWATYKLLLSELDTTEEAGWWRANFGAGAVAPARSAASPYAIRGGFGAWLKAQFPRAQYRFATAEFGTYSPLRVFRALADELHWHAKLGTVDPDHVARRRLTQIFAPRNRRWRMTTLRAGVALIDRAVGALTGSAGARSGVRVAS